MRWVRFEKRTMRRDLKSKRCDEIWKVNDATSEILKVDDATSEIQKVDDATSEFRKRTSFDRALSEVGRSFAWHGPGTGPERRLKYYRTGLRLSNRLRTPLFSGKMVRSQSYELGRALVRKTRLGECCGTKAGTTRMAKTKAPSERLCWIRFT